MSNKYQQLAKRCIDDIKAGKLAIGERMISLRNFAKIHHVSISTAVNCYEQLSAEGWITAKAQSGFYVCNPTTKLAPAPVWNSFERTPAVIASKKALPRKHSGPLGVSTLELSEQTEREFNACLKRAIRRSSQQLMLYPEASGEKSLRDALARHFSQLGFTLSADELVITHGCLDAVKSALLSVTQTGDTIAVSSPCFHGLLSTLSALKLKLIEIPSRNDGIDLDELESLLKQGTIQAGLFSTTHMNPQGITMSDAQKQRLARLANQYRTPIIEDDVYFELSHTEQATLPASFYDTNGYMIWCSSMSKTLTPSYRLGWCRPGRFLATYLGQNEEVATFTQLALSEFINTGAYSKHLKRARKQLNQNKRHYLDFLSQNLPEQSQITHPDGGLVLWLKIPGLQTKWLTQQAQKAGIDVRIGPQFTQSNRYQDSLRLNIGFAMTEQIKQQLTILIKLIYTCKTMPPESPTNSGVA
ncbi:aminotransferase-like domain-containing protein [Celerinatantimonas diazotrophica]|uniref:GntR family transcriptional regulator n=1 Tax=Celerinatantimonas diazotrophica TaxID=412034 RepID=A0A4R1J7R8_9GAMM|nr:PLP-dependent aminotransferase family protein [Celerinatantimonas diazotrophica]TCK46548.1 GntR family transcriptional regulator [Celerinatantimonas diazotrophica]CAG9296598.1 HTH-type transcriptional regulator NorG [Celerinatantimonas diazotrophica]